MSVKRISNLQVPLHRVNDLAAVAGIGPRTIERIRPRVLVGADAD